MKRLSIVMLATFLTVLSAAAEEDGGHQSYISYDAGDTVIQQGFDGRTIDGRVNLPIFEGDLVKTDRRGRSEIRLADGNVVAIDHNAALRFHSVFREFEGNESAQTVIELEYGQAIVHRLTDEGIPLRLDTRNSSFVSDDYSLYAVLADGFGGDQVAVFSGAVEVRTQQGGTRLRAGEAARIDSDGRLRIEGLARNGMDDFQRWYLERSDRYNGHASRYLESRVAYAGSDLDDHGTWVWVHDYGSWVWRPRVSVGWRPYYYGRWVSGRTGSLIWVSDEPWGWVPYHYGRWTYSGLYGWIWLPGSYYSPAWVYWMYGPSYVGWVPSGWYDCYRPYYPWLYRGYSPRHHNVGFGFWGRITLREHDLNGWTVVDPDRIVSTRVDRAALTTDVIRNRLRRDGGDATLSNVPARFSKDEIRDPGSAVQRLARGGTGVGTGNERDGSLPDATSFFRRDPDLSDGTRERIVRSVARPESSADSSRSVNDRFGRDTSAETPSTNRSGQSLGRTRPVDALGSSDRGASPSSSVDRSGARDSSEKVRSRSIRKDASDPTPRGGVDSTSGSVSRETESWRSGSGVGNAREGTTRGRTVVRESSPQQADERESAKAEGEAWRAAPVPRRVIDSIGGTKITPRSDEAPSGSSRGRSVTREQPKRDAGSGASIGTSPSRSSSSTRSRGASQSSGSVQRATPPRSGGTSTSSGSSSSSRGSAVTKPRATSPPKSSSSASSKSSSSSTSQPKRVTRKKPDGE